VVKEGKKMIGFVYVRDIPKIIISLIIGIVILVPLVALFAYFFPNGCPDCNQSVWMICAVLILAGVFAFSMWAGWHAWEWIQINVALWGDKRREKRMANCYTCQCAPEWKHDSNWQVWYECPRCGRRGKSYHMVFDNNATRNAIVSWEETIKTASATITKK